MKVKTSKGFTLAELLIVMAIIVVLAAVAVPTFGRQLETSRETGDLELVRAAYTEALSIAVLDGTDGKMDANNGEVSLANVFGTNTVTAASGKTTIVVPLNGDLTQINPGWQYVGGKIAGIAVGDGTSTPIVGKNKATFVFTIDSTSHEVALDSATTSITLTS